MNNLSIFIRYILRTFRGTVTIVNTLVSLVFLALVIKSLRRVEKSYSKHESQFVVKANARCQNLCVMGLCLKWAYERDRDIREAAEGVFRRSLAVFSRDRSLRISASLWFTFMLIEMEYNAIKLSQPWNKDPLKSFHWWTSTTVSSVHVAKDPLRSSLEFVWEPGGFNLKILQYTIALTH